jgi:HEAT repeat protein
MNRVVLLWAIAVLLASCGKKEEPLPVPPLQPPKKILPDPSSTSTASPGTPVVETPVPAAPKKPDPALLLKLAEDLKSPEAKVRQEAAARLISFGADAESALPALVENLRTREKGAWETTSDVLVAIGPAAVPSLIPLLKDRTPSTRARTMRTLGALGPKAEAAATALIEGLGGGDRELIRMRLTALVQIGKPAVPALIEALNRHSKDGQGREMREDLAIVLLELGSEGKGAREAFKTVALNWPGSREADVYAKLYGSPRAVPVIAADLSHEHPGTRQKAALEIQQLGPDAKEAIPALMEALRKGNVPVALGPAIRAVGPDAIPPLLKMMESEPEPIFRRAVSVLEDFDLPADVAPRLAAMLSSPNDFVVEGAISVLSKLGPKGSAAIPTALSLLKSPRRPARLQALRFLGRTGSSEVASALAGFLKDPEPNIRADVLKTLGEMGAAAVPVKQAIRELLKDPIPAIRSLAEAVLKKLDGTK